MVPVSDTRVCREFRITSTIWRGLSSEEFCSVDREYCTAAMAAPTTSKLVSNSDVFFVIILMTREFPLSPYLVTGWGEGPIRQLDMVTW